MSDVRYELRDGAAWLTMTRPEGGNPIDPPMVSALHEAIDKARADDARVVVLTAEGKAFCVGGNIGLMGAEADPGAFLQNLAHDLHAMVLALQSLDAIVVSSVQGTAAGAGFPLAAAADLVLAADTARFTLAYTKIGLTPDGGSSLLAATVGLHQALRLALLNPLLSAQQAFEIGIVTAVHPADELAAATEALVAQLLAGSRAAQVGAKQLIRGKVTPTVKADLDLEADRLARAASSPDGREGVHAFLDKRAPAFPSNG